MDTSHINPLSEKEASEINPIIESVLKHEVVRYQVQILRICLRWRLIDILRKRIARSLRLMPILQMAQTPIPTRWIWEAVTGAKENNIKNTIETQVGEERKRLKDEYD